jgi:hypothetical protein
MILWRETFFERERERERERTRKQKVGGFLIICLG